MIKKVLSPLGVAALFVLGAPATAYSDSLPAFAASTAQNDVSCISQNNVAITNTCNRAIHVFIPYQSRAGGTHQFIATAPQADQTQCNVIAKDFSNNHLWQSNWQTLNNRMLVGSWSVRSDAVIFYDCFIQPGKNLLSIDVWKF